VLWNSLAFQTAPGCLTISQDWMPRHSGATSVWPGNSGPPSVMMRAVLKSSHTILFGTAVTRVLLKNPPGANTAVKYGSIFARPNTYVPSPEMKSASVVNCAATCGPLCAAQPFTTPCGTARICACSY
jgi:hypothetical protein